MMLSFEQVEAYNHNRGECLAGCVLCREAHDRRKAWELEQALRRMFRDEYMEER